MKLIIRESVFANLETIRSWIAQDSSANADAVVRRIVQTINGHIAIFPAAGRRAAEAGTREWVVHGLPYIIVYQIDDNRRVVTVLAIFHAAQNR